MPSSRSQDPAARTGIPNPTSSDTQQKYQAVLESMDQGYFLSEVLFDENGQPTDILYLESNPAAARMVGQDYVGRTLREIDPAFESYWIDIWARVVRTGKPERHVRYAKPLDTWYDFNVFRVGGTGSKLVANLFQDITARMRAETALRASEQRFHSVLENMSEGVMLFDPEVNLIYQNPASLKIHGFAPDQQQLEHEKVPVTWKAWDQSGRPITYEEWPVSRVFRLERFQDQVLRVVRVETGQEFYGSYNGSPILGPDGKLVLGFITIRDITEQVRAKQALQDNERRLRAFYESELMGALYWNMAGQITAANSKFLRMVGYTREEIVSGTVSWQQMTPAEYRPLDEYALHELKTLGVDTPYEKQYIRKDGSRVDILIGAAMLEETRFEGVAFVLDISDRKRAEKAAAELQRKLDSALLAGEVGTFEWGVAEDRLWGDRNFAQLFGVPLDSSGSAPISRYIEVIHPDDRPGVIERLNRTLETGCVYEAEYRIANGDRTRWVVARGTGERDGTGRVVRFPGVLIDITDRKQAEQALRESEQQFRTLAESMPQLVWTADSAGAVNYVNERWCAYTGRAPASAKQDGWVLSIHPDDAEKVKSTWLNTVSTGELYQAEYRLRGADGQYRWFLARALPLKDGAGRISRWFGTATDMDDQKRTVEALQQSQQELRTAKEQLDRANADLEKTVQDRTARLRDTVAELEHFSYTITHDMRAPLRAMQAFGQILREEYHHRLDEMGVDYLRRIVSAASRMDALITDSLNYAKAVQSELALGPVDCRALLQGIVESYPQFQPPLAQIELIGNFPDVLANTAGLTQCFSNILGNAVKFVTAGTTPHVKVWAETRDEMVRLWFEDNGIGIAPDQQQKVFVMFQRLSRDYEGTGVGLALVRKMAEKMRGRVGFESKPGEGSRFWLEFVKAEARHQNTPSHHA